MKECEGVTEQRHGETSSGNVTERRRFVTLFRDAFP